MMEKENLDLRSGVLYKSLILEDSLSKIIIKLIRVKKEDLKTLGHKGSAFSFQTKADLLYDLERIEKPLYSNLKLFMEVRNQFIHNIDSDSFLIVFSRISKTPNQLLKNFAPLLDVYKKSNDELEKESVLKSGFEKLFELIKKELDVLSRGIEVEIASERQKEIDNLSLSIYKDGLKFYDEAIDEFALEFNKDVSDKFGYNSELGSVMKRAIMYKLKKKLNDYYKINL